MNSPTDTAMLCAMETLQSLNLAVREAGGAPMDLEYLRMTSALDLVLIFACNGIRFTRDENAKTP